MSVGRKCKQLGIPAKKKKIKIRVNEKYVDHKDMWQTKVFLKQQKQVLYQSPGFTSLSNNQWTRDFTC